jgi:hypothetical protein
MHTETSLDLPYYGKTMCFDVIGDVVLVLHATESPSPIDWDRCMRTAGEVGRRLGTAPRLLVGTLGGRPNALQRATYAELLGRGMVAVVTDSAAVRTVVHYMSIFNPAIRAFADFEAALAFLGRPEIPIDERMRSFEAWFESRAGSHAQAP